MKPTYKNLSFSYMLIRLYFKNYMYMFIGKNAET